MRASLPPQPRRRSLAGLEAQIAQAEGERARWRAEAARLEAVGRDGAAARGMLGLTERRLAHLARSRQVLLRGEEGHEDDEPA